MRVVQHCVDVKLPTATANPLAVFASFGMYCRRYILKVGFRFLAMVLLVIFA